jgi:hypothetical protein
MVSSWGCILGGRLEDAQKAAIGASMIALARSPPEVANRAPRSLRCVRRYEVTRAPAVQSL